MRPRIVSTGDEGISCRLIHTHGQEFLEGIFRLHTLEARRVVLGSDDDEVVVRKAAVVDPVAGIHEGFLLARRMHSKDITIATSCDLDSLPCSLRCDQQVDVILLFENGLEIIEKPCVVQAGGGGQQYFLFLDRLSGGRSSL